MDKNDRLRTRYANMLLVGIGGMFASVFFFFYFIKMIKAFFFVATFFASVYVLNKALSLYKKIPSK